MFEKTEINEKEAGVDPFLKKQYSIMGSGCGSVYRVVPSDTSGQSYKTFYAGKLRR